MPTDRNVPSIVVAGGLKGTRATNDEELLQSWLASLGSSHTKRNFETTARRFLAALPTGLRAATVEDVRDALSAISSGLGPGTARQYVLRIKSLLSYANRLGYSPFNAGTTIKVRSEIGGVPRSRSGSFLRWRSVC